MGWSDELIKKAQATFAWLFHDMRSVKIIVYLCTVIFILTAILMLFTFSYTGSGCPFNLWNYNNISYSYAGSPNYALIYANDYDIGINGANNSKANITISGESNITLYATGGIDAAPYGNKIVREKENKYRIHTLPDDITNVYIDKTQDEAFNYNLLFKYNASNVSAIAGECGQSECFKLVKKGDGYLIKSKFQGPAEKKFSIKHYGNNSYPIFIRTRKNTASDIYPDNYRVLNYMGRVRIQTNGSLEMEIPASEISPLAKPSIKKVEIYNSDGTLDVRHTEYKCSHADNINLTATANNTGFKLLNGKVSIAGNAESLEFRDRYFHYPMTVILKEGNFTIITGLLMAFFTFFLTRLYSQFKKKSE